VGTFEDPSDQRSDGASSDSGKVQFVAGCEPMKVRHVRWRVDCKYSEWIPGGCSASCGPGTVLATREKIGGLLNGNGCSLETERREPCQLEECASPAAQEGPDDAEDPPMIRLDVPARPSDRNEENFTNHSDTNSSATGIGVVATAENTILHFLGFDQSKQDHAETATSHTRGMSEKDAARTKAPCGCDIYCRSRVNWVMTTSIHTHPNWFMSFDGKPGLNASSTFDEVHQYLYDLKTKFKGTREAPLPPCTACGCDDSCREQVEWIIRSDIYAHPGRYAPFDRSPGLNANSTFYDVQLYLHTKKATNDDDGRLKAPQAPCATVDATPKAGPVVEETAHIFMPEAQPHIDVTAAEAHRLKESLAASSRTKVAKDAVKKAAKRAKLLAEAAEAAKAAEAAQTIADMEAEKVAELSAAAEAASKASKAAEKATRAAKKAKLFADAVDAAQAAEDAEAPMNKPLRRRPT